MNKNSLPTAPRYSNKRECGIRYQTHPNNIPRRVRRGTFISPTIWFGEMSPRWANDELDLWDAFLALTRDPREATRRVLEERAERLASLQRADRHG